MKELVTNHKILKAKKFFLCIHQASNGMIDFEKAENRFTQYTYLEYGQASLYAFLDDIIEEVKMSEEKKLYDVRKYKNCNVVGKAAHACNAVSFNPLRKDEDWEATLLSKSGELVSDKIYSVIICLSGEFAVNGKKFKQYEYAELEQNKTYNIKFSKGSQAGLFELVKLSLDFK